MLMVDKLTPRLERRSELAGVELLEGVELFALQHLFEDLETLLHLVEVSVVTLLGTKLLDTAPVQLVLHLQFKLFS